MSNIHATTGELETLSKIINEIRPSADFIDQLDQFTQRLNEVIPFKRCLLLHEREGKSLSRGFAYFNGGREEGFVGQSKLSSAIGIEAYSARFAKFNQIDHAFQWASRDNLDLGVPETQNELLTRMQGRSGLAASVRSAISGTDDVHTFWQFECDEVGVQHPLLLSFVAFYLHSTFTLHAVDHQVKDDFFGINLTNKERDVLRWVVEGKTSWEIGRILYTSERTVKFHLKNVYAKLNVSNRAQAVAVVNRLRLI